MRSKIKRYADKWVNTNSITGSLNHLAFSLEEGGPSSWNADYHARNESLKPPSPYLPLSLRF